MSEPKIEYVIAICEYIDTNGLCGEIECFDCPVMKLQDKLGEELN